MRVYVRARSKPRDFESEEETFAARVLATENGYPSPNAMNGIENRISFRVALRIGARDIDTSRFIIVPS